MKAAYAFTKLVVRDLEAMAAYYREVFGMTELRRVQADIAGEPIDEIIFGAGDTYSGLILLHWVGQEAPPQGEVLLGFATPDIEALFARAEAAGGTVREAPHPVAEAGGLTVGFVADPEGHLAEVVLQPL